MKYLLLVSLAITMLSCNSQKRASIGEEKETTENKTQQDNYVKGELIVLFADKEDYNKTIETLKAYENVELISMLSEMENAKTAHFRVPIGKENDYIKIFQKHSNVEVAELNLIVSYN